MICGRLQDFEMLGLGATSLATRRAVAWIRALPAAPEESTTELGGGLRALVLRYPTQEQSAALFETHRQYVDLQYTVRGCEVLEWAPRAALAAEGDYNESKDLLLHASPPMASRIAVAEGCFALFTPLDAHRGGLRAAGAGPEVLKLVVKIPMQDFALIPTL